MGCHLSEIRARYAGPPPNEMAVTKYIKEQYKETRDKQKLGLIHALTNEIRDSVKTFDSSLVLAIAKAYSDIGNSIEILNDEEMYRSPLRHLLSAFGPSPAAVLALVNFFNEVKNSFIFLDLLEKLDLACAKGTESSNPLKNISSILFGKIDPDTLPHHFRTFIQAEDKEKRRYDHANRLMAVCVRRNLFTQYLRDVQVDQLLEEMLEDKQATQAAKLVNLMSFDPPLIRRLAADGIIHKIIDQDEVSPEERDKLVRTMQRAGVDFRTGKPVPAQTLPEKTSTLIL